MTLIRRRPDLSADAFGVYWAGPHAAIARDYPGLRRYVQNHVVRRLDPATVDSFDCDGMAELSFASDTAMRAALASPVSQALVADEPTFLSGVTGLLLTAASAPQDRSAEDNPAHHGADIVRVIVLGRADGAQVAPGAPPGALAHRAARVAEHWARAGLWSVTAPPDTVLVADFPDIDAARAAIDPAKWPVLATLSPWHAYQVRMIRIV